MNILFIHQNAPGQFIHLSKRLFELGNNVKFIGISKFDYPGIESLTYLPNRNSSNNIHPWVVDFESQIIRAEQVLILCKNLKKTGYIPDIIYFHPGWGEAFFLDEIWNTSKKIAYCEYYYNENGFDFSFDKEFSTADENVSSKLRVKNLLNELQISKSDILISPTNFQKSTFPKNLQNKIQVIHDGINTSICKPNHHVSITLKKEDGIEFELNKTNLVLTFISRNLEPYRGYHIFMRSLPKIMKKIPNLNVLIIGGCNRGYGTVPKFGNWKNIFLNEISNEIDLSKIFFLGNVSYENYIKILQISSTHVYLTYPFVLSWSLLEAMSIACKIVASNTAPVNEFISHNINGILIDFFDIDNLSNNIVNILQNQNDYEYLGINSRKTILDNYDLNNFILPRQIEIIKSVVQ